MILNKEKVDGLSEAQFKILLSFIGIDELKKDLISNAGSFPKTSAYYIGPRTTGQFWSGFRKEKIPESKVIKFYISEVLQKKTKLDTDFFYDSIEKRVNSISTFDESYILKQDTNLREVLCIVFDVEIDESTQKHINEIFDLKKEHEEAIKTLEEEYLKRIEELKSETIQQKNEYENKIKSLSQKLMEMNVVNEQDKKAFLLGVLVSIKDFHLIINL